MKASACLWIFAFLLAATVVSAQSVQVEDNSSIQINSGGHIEVAQGVMQLGTDATDNGNPELILVGSGITDRGAKLTLSGTASGRVYGRIRARYFTLTVNNNPIAFETSAGTGPFIEDFNFGDVSITGTGPALDFCDAGVSSDRTYPYSFIDVDFSSGGTPYNVRANSNNFSIWFLGGSGTAWGAAREDDAGGRVNWDPTPIVEVIESTLDDSVTVTVTNNSTTVTRSAGSWNTGVGAGDIFRVVGEVEEYTIASVGAGTLTLASDRPYRGDDGSGKAYEILDYSSRYGSVDAAIRSLSNGETGRFRCTSTAPTSEGFDFEASNANSAAGVILENFFWYRLTGNGIDDSGSSRRVTLRNCAIARGNVSWVNFQNCTVFDPRAGGVSTIANCAAQNTIFEHATPGLPGGDTTNLKGQTAALFVNADDLDFHLKSGSSTAIDQGTAIGGGYAMDFEGDGRPTGGGWDIGFDESGGTGTWFTYIVDGAMAADLGYIYRIENAYVGGQWKVYAVSGGGSTSGTDRSHRIHRIDLATGALEASSEVLAGPVTNMKFYSSAGVYYLYVVVDRWNDRTNSAGQDGYGDAIQYLTDNSGFSLVSTFGDNEPTDPTNGDGILDIGSNGASPNGRGGRIEWLKVVGISGTNYLFFVKLTREMNNSALRGETEATLYKVNATTGVAQWAIGGPSEAGQPLTCLSYKGAPAYTADGGGNYSLWVPMSDAAGSDMLVKVDMMDNGAGDGSDEDSLPDHGSGPDAYWDSDGTGTKNDLGPALSRAVGNVWHFYIAPSNGNRMISTTQSANTDQARYITAANKLGGGGSAVFKTWPFRYWGDQYVLLQCGDYVEKVRDDGTGAAVAKAWPVPSSSSDNGWRVENEDVYPAAAPDGDIDGIFPVKVKGSVTQWILKWGTWLYFVTDEGWVYIVKYRPNTLVKSYKEQYLSGFPRRLPGRPTWVNLLPLTTSAGGLQVGLDNGSVVKITGY